MPYIKLTFSEAVHSFKHYYLSSYNMPRPGTGNIDMKGYCLQEIRCSRTSAVPTVAGQLGKCQYQTVGGRPGLPVVGEGGKEAGC